MQETILSFPSLNHPQVLALCQYDFDLPVRDLDTILSLPVDTLVEDLEALIRHGLNLFKIDDLDVDNYYIFHSMMLLGHLRSERSLPLILEVFNLSDEDNDALFGDLFLEDMWCVPVLCAQNQLDKLVEFIKSGQKTPLYGKVNVADALKEIGLHFPERRAEVGAHMLDLLHYFNELPDEAVTDLYYLIGTVANNAADLDMQETLPVIEALFEKKRIDEWIRGDWEVFLSEWGAYPHEKDRLHLDVRDWYRVRGKKWLDIIARNEQIEAEVQTKLVVQKKNPDAAANGKIGRNDPCPCGSGKKYKKCHGQ